MLLAEPDAIVTSPWQRIAIAVVVTIGELAMAPVGMVLGRTR
jgi:dipeptide/tripeptide permease